MNDEEQANPEPASEEPASPDQSNPPESRIPLPPASFSFLVLSLRAQAEMQLGLMHFGPEEKPEPDLPIARHTIDMLGVLLVQRGSRFIACAKYPFMAPISPRCAAMHAR